MKSIIRLQNETFSVALDKPIDISLKLEGNNDNPRAWYLGAPQITPVTDGDWVGKVTEGAGINFNSITFSPHAHGTHTESYGHISKEFYSVANCLDRFFFKAKLISVFPEPCKRDRLITDEILRENLQEGEAEALIIRTLPNKEAQRHKNYDHTNWPYLTEAAAQYIRKCGIQHLLLDLPSVDREEGEVQAHRAFWHYPDNPRKKATITEFIFVPNTIKDGFYLLNLQVAHFENDAAPSRPVLYTMGVE